MKKRIFIAIVIFCLSLGSFFRVFHSGPPPQEPYLPEKIFISLLKKDYNHAASFAAQVVDQDPKNASAYETLFFSFLYQNDYYGVLQTAFDAAREGADTIEMHDIACQILLESGGFQALLGELARKEQCWQRSRIKQDPR